MGRKGNDLSYSLSEASPPSKRRSVEMILCPQGDVCCCLLIAFVSNRLSNRAVYRYRARLSVTYKKTEWKTSSYQHGDSQLSAGPLFSTHPNPSHQTTDPTQPNPSRSKNFRPTNQPNPQLSIQSSFIQSTTNLRAQGRQF